MLKRGSLGYKKITEDTDNFSLEGMLEPTFYNFGEEDVLVLHSVIKPGNRFLAGGANIVMEGEVPIQFVGTNKKNRNLAVYFIKPASDC